MSKLKSMTPVTTLNIAAGISEPPGDPVTKNNLLSLSKTIVGAIVLIGFFPGSNLFPGLAALPISFLSSYL